MAEHDAALSKLYYEAGDSGSYGGVDRLYKRAKEAGISGVTRDTVSRFLSDQHSYSLHKPARKNFIRNKTYVSGIDKQWQADLADMQALSRTNNGYRYLLTCIDVFSKVAWVVPVKDKSGRSIAEAFQTLLEEHAKPRKPERLQTDKGKEFLNRLVQDVFKQWGIHHFYSWSDKKAAVVERFNRTLKTRLWTYFTAHQTRRYVDILQDVVKSYNNSVHRSIGMRPAEVRKEHETKIWIRLYGSGGTAPPPSVTEAIPVGQKVRISDVKGQFEKGYMPNWSEEHFVVREAAHFPKRVYKIADTGGEELKGKWYKQELQPIEKNRYLIERVIRRRTNAQDGAREALVKWKGWPEKFNTWIPEDDIEHVQ